MAHMFQGFWDRVQGRSQLKRVCEKVFNEYANKDNKLDLNNLHLAILLVYNSMNKQYQSPHKEPPSRTEIEEKIRAYKREKKSDSISEEELYEMALEWTRKDLRIVMSNKLMLSMLAAPSLVAITRRAGRRLPRIGSVVDKVPTTVFFSVYSIALFFFQDVTMGH